MAPNGPGGAKTHKFEFGVNPKIFDMYYMKFSWESENDPELKNWKSEDFFQIT